ncbi:Uncharacterized conserved protein, DUF58 family, contains vWF domain [Singulisphaera sp. GP187]|uniref:DUF58 domain-containing protein n=1 Tax=Singulisphaera sp. GP187 TaxID=1882752 RepID=UPI000925B6ED|nr:DUF58 domain-containing protein [Singulisphaera sp. GP187]SIO08924.1 Uncharacterized conserved protein, DUF58 family, contains vWF domain [Singulisphaera sp. GP187]
MIWPGRALAFSLLIPALLSLGLFVSDSLGPAVLALDLVVGLVAVADLATLIGAGAFRAERRCGTVSSLGEAQQVELSLFNLGRLGRIFRARDDVPDAFTADPADFVVSVPARGRATLLYTIVPKQRGTYTFCSVDALVSSRLGFWQRAVSWPVETVVRVYPDIRQIGRYTVLARRDKLSTMGVRRTRRLGTDNEFERLRDYTEGDEPRHMDWRATARRRKLTVRAHQVNQSQRLIFLIDCGRMMAGDTGQGLSPLDHALNSMLMLAHIALIRGDQVGLLAFSDRVLAYVPPNGGAKRVKRLVHSVHNIFPEMVESRYDRVFVELEKRCRKRSLVVMMTNLFDDVNAQIIGDHLANVVGRHLPLGVFLRDHDIFALADNAPNQGLGLYQGAAAAALLNWRERALSSLRTRGVMTLDLFPNELTAPLINQYLQIKARHLL